MIYLPSTLLHRAVNPSGVFTQVFQLILALWICLNKCTKFQNNQTRGFGVIVILNFNYMKKFLKFLLYLILLRRFWPFVLKIQKIPS